MTLWAEIDFTLSTDSSSYTSMYPKPEVPAVHPESARTTPPSAPDILLSNHAKPRDSQSMHHRTLHEAFKALDVGVKRNVTLKKFHSEVRGISMDGLSVRNESLPSPNIGSYPSGYPCRTGCTGLGRWTSVGVITSCEVTAFVVLSCRPCGSGAGYRGERR